MRNKNLLCLAISTPCTSSLESDDSQSLVTLHSFISRGQWLPSQSSQRPTTPQSFIPAANDSPVVHPSSQRLPSQWFMFWNLGHVQLGSPSQFQWFHLETLEQGYTVIWENCCKWSHPFLGIWLRNQISCNCILQRVSNIWGNHCPNWQVIACAPSKKARFIQHTQSEPWSTLSNLTLLFIVNFNITMEIPRKQGSSRLPSLPLHGEVFAQLYGFLVGGNCLPRNEVCNIHCQVVLQHVIYYG